MPPGWLNIEAPDDLVFGTEKSAFPLELTRTERLIGFGACYAGGLGISVLGAILLMTGQGRAFAMFIALGAIVSLTGTGFLLGFKRQWTLMFKPVRLAAALIMLGAIILCFVAALWKVIPTFLCLIFVIIQYLAMAWYSISYIPYARQAVKSFVSNAV